MTEDEMFPYEYRPLSELPADVDPVNDRAWGWGSNPFDNDPAKRGSLVIYKNVELGEATPLYEIPAPVVRILRDLEKVRYQAGRQDVRRDIVKALGLD